MIEIKHIHKAFGNNVLFRDLSLTIETGSIVCIMGPSGEGKTTLLRMIAGLEPVDLGEIHKPSTCSVSMVFQEDRLCESLSAIENIRMVTPSISHIGAVNALNDFQLDRDTSLLPVSALSGGMRRRVALLRALLHPSDLLLLDEPFNGLDHALRDTIIEKTRPYLQKKTVILVTHDINEANLLGARILDIKK